MSRLITRSARPQSMIYRETLLLIQMHYLSSTSFNCASNEHEEKCFKQVNRRHNSTID